MSDNILSVVAILIALAAIVGARMPSNLSKKNAMAVERLEVKHSEQQGAIESVESCDCNCGPDCGCGATTTVVAEDAPVKRIYFHTMPGGGCPPCDAWRRTELDKAIKAGWEVEIIEGGCKSYPRFRVYSDIKKPGVWQVGFATFAELKGMVE